MLAETVRSVVRIIGILVGIAIATLTVWAFASLWMLMPEVRL